MRISTSVSIHLRRSPFYAMLAALALAAGINLPAAASEPASEPASASAAAGAAFTLPQPPATADDPCQQKQATANPTRPAWDYGASTTQCGVAEFDSGWQWQPMGGGVDQRMLFSSVRYGLTPKLDLRVGMNEQMTQEGGGQEALKGIGDQWLGARYRFYEQGRHRPAMALLYAGKVPTANPAKGFGSGYVDHQLIFIASRDLGKYHLDFNTVGTIVGIPHGHDGAAQFGLALTRPVNSKLSLILESYGGPQPGTSNRFGAAFGGATYALRPGLVFDTAYTRTYTAGSPRSQVLAGITYAMHPGIPQLPRTGRFAHLLGR